MKVDLHIALNLEKKLSRISAFVLSYVTFSFSIICSIHMWNRISYGLDNQNIRICSLHRVACAQILERMVLHIHSWLSMRDSCCSSKSDILKKKAKLGIEIAVGLQEAMDLIAKILLPNYFWPSTVDSFSINDFTKSQ